MEFLAGQTEPNFLNSKSRLSILIGQLWIGFLPAHLSLNYASNPGVISTDLPAGQDTSKLVLRR